MNTLKKLLAFLSVAVMVTACGSDEGATTTTTVVATSTTTVVTTSTTPTTTTMTAPVGVDDSDDATADGGAVPWSMEAAGPGTFASTRFAAPFTFVLDDGWLPIFPEGEEILNMRLPDRAALFVLENEAESVESLLTNVAGQADVELENPRDVEVGGVGGVRFEADGDGVVRLRSATGEFESNLQEEALRMTVVAVSDTVVVMVEVTPIDDPESARPETLAVIDSIMWISG